MTIAAYLAHHLAIAHSLSRLGVDAREDSLVFSGRSAEHPAVSDVIRRVYEDRNSLMDRELHWLMRWASCGFPRVETTDRQAASFMSTTMPPESVGDVVFPWTTFAVVLPSGLLQTRAASVNLLAVDLYKSRSKAHLLAIDTERDVRLSSGSLPLEAFGEPYDKDEPLDDRDLRALLLARRLVVGCCVALSSPEERSQKEKEERLARTTASRRRRLGAVPTSWAYRLTAPVVVDTREAVAAFLSGTRKSPSVRWLTRGHWRRQTYGLRNSLRRWQHIEPYWNGVTDGPIAVRPHVIGGRP